MGGGVVPTWLTATSQSCSSSSTTSSHSSSISSSSSANSSSSSSTSSSGLGFMLTARRCRSCAVPSWLLQVNEANLHRHLEAHSCVGPEVIVTYTDSHFVAKRGIGAMACSRTVHGAVPSCCRYSLSGRAAHAFFGAVLLLNSSTPSSYFRVLLLLLLLLLL